MCYLNVSESQGRFLIAVISPLAVIGMQHGISEDKIEHKSLICVVATFGEVCFPSLTTNTSGFALSQVLILFIIDNYTLA